MCPWHNCEPVTQLISPSKTNSFFKKYLIEFSMTKMTQNSIYLALVGFLIMKWSPKNCTHQGLPPIMSRAHPAFSKNLVLLSFQWKNCSIFNNSTTIGLNIMNPLWCTLNHQRVSNHTKCMTTIYMTFGWQNLSMLSFTSQKSQLPINTINKIMLNSSNSLLKCATKPYPKVWFY
jgi:hypothetical protein